MHYRSTMVSEISKTAPQDATLQRRLGVMDLTAIFVGVILGSGIFVAPAAVAAYTPSFWGGIAFWFFGGLITLFGAFCYAECGTRLPHTGGFYVFYREAYGPAIAFVGGWAAFLITFPASVAAIALISAQYAATIVPSLADYTAPTAAGVLIIGGVINAAGMRSGPNAQRLLSSVKLLALVALGLAAIFHAPSTDIPTPAVEGALNGASGAALITALMVLMWTYDGWSTIALVAGEVKNPRRTLPRAMALGTLLLFGAYALVHLAVISILSAPTAAASQSVFADAVTARLGGGSGKIVAALIVISTLGASAAANLTGARIGFAMAADGQLPTWLAGVHPRWGTPARSIAVLTAISIVYVFTGGFDTLLGFFSFSVWIFYGLVGFAVIIFRRRKTGENEAWKSPGGLLIPIALILTAAAMTTGVLVQMPKQSLAGLALLALGFPVYFLRLHMRRNRAAPD